MTGHHAVPPRRPPVPPRTRLAACAVSILVGLLFGLLVTAVGAESSPWPTARGWAVAAGAITLVQLAWDRRRR